MTTPFGSQLWAPPADVETEMTRFTQFVKSSTGLSLSATELQRWSVTEFPRFWELCAEFCEIKWQSEPEPGVYRPCPRGTMRGGNWFPGAKLNYAENLLAKATTATPAVISALEGLPTRSYSWRELTEQTADVRAWLQSQGVQKGDRVAGVLSNSFEAVVCMLATTSLGAVWASCSPDFGAQAIVDRLQQIDPKIIFATTAYQYNNKTFSTASTIATWQSALSGQVFKVDHASENPLPSPARKAPIQFTACDFSDPLFILFSSGTTGIPKCMVHSVGGTLLQHKKEHILHSNIKQGDRLFYFTTCGWMMWNWLVSGLATGSTILTFDGSVTCPDLSIVWEFCDQNKVTAFGTSPKYLSLIEKHNYNPKDHFDLKALRTVFSTGSPLLPEQFSFVYERVKSSVHLSSICGGTDIVSCFMLGNPNLPVHAGEIQGFGLGMDGDAWDHRGESVRNTKGELVCKTPFPSMPTHFWNDESGDKYRKAYFEVYGENIWRHGDYIEIAETGGIRVFGRSDATLNPGGVRIGTAEIYRVVESLPGVADCIAAGFEVDGDTEIALFVKQSNGSSQIEDSVSKSIRHAIKAHLSPRHLPRHIVAVKDIPYTRSGKKVELAVTETINGRPVLNQGAMANPNCLEEFKQWHASQ